MSADTIKRLAADIFKCGKNRIRIKEGETARAMEALTREDVRGLIDEKVVYKLRYVGPRTKPPRKKKGSGKRKGKKFSRKGEKEGWMERLRSQRKYLTELLESGELPKKYKRKAYLKVKGGSFKGKKALRVYLEENGMFNAKAAEKKVKTEAKPEAKKEEEKPAAKAKPKKAAAKKPAEKK